jgi:ribosomal protein S9
VLVVVVEVDVVVVEVVDVDVDVDVDVVVGGNDRQGGEIRAGSRKALVHQPPLTSPTTAVAHPRRGEP